MSADHSFICEGGVLDGSLLLGRRWARLSDHWQNAVVVNRLYFTPKDAQHMGEANCTLGLFSAANGMAAYIQWRRIPERSHTISKIMVHFKKGRSPDPVYPDHPKSIASILKYEGTLASD